MFEIFLTILYQFMVAKYFHKFYIFQKSYFKESYRFLLFPVVWAFKLSVNLRSGIGLLNS